MTTNNEVLDAIRKLPCLAIPDGWFHAPELRSGKSKRRPIVRIFILAEIVSQHTVQEVLDFGTFRQGWLPEEMRQCTYAELSKKFGCSKELAKVVCHFLRDRGLITLEYRTVESVEEIDGALVHHVTKNVPFMAPVRPPGGRDQRNASGHRR